MTPADHIHVYVRYDSEASYSISIGAWEARIPGSPLNAWGATKEEAVAHLEQGLRQAMNTERLPELLVLEIPQAQ